MTIDNAALRQFILQSFSDEELDTLCFDYFPEVVAEFGHGMSQNRKAIVLISHCQRRGRMDDLHAALERERADAWKQQFGVSDVKKPGFSEETRFLAERDPRQVFLSHATADKEFAHRLAGDLRAEGWRVWIAPESIRAGEKWAEAIDRGLEESGVFVVALTPDAVASHWVKTETNAALEMQHEGQIVFIPLDVLPSKPPRLWLQYQYISFRDSYEVGLDALLTRLDNLDASQAIAQSRVEIIPAPFPVLDPPAQQDRRIHEKTGIELVRIPSGPFIYGVYKEMVDLPEYWISRAPVTNLDYRKFLNEDPEYPVPSGFLGGKFNWDKRRRVFQPFRADHPVVFVTWHDAQAFCEWAELALPTEEQWEKATRGKDGRIWPWGDHLTYHHCNLNGSDTTPVDRYSPKGDSPYGCVDTVGNVWEWTASSSTKLWYVEKGRVLRGGSWMSKAGELYTTYQRILGADSKENDVGFRVVELLSDPGF